MMKFLSKTISLAALAVLLMTPFDRAEAGMPGIPQCKKAYDTLVANESLKYTIALIRNDCAVMYRNNWLIGNGKTADICKAAWDNLQKQKMLAATQALVTRNCPVIYARGWRKP